MIYFHGTTDFRLDGKSAVTLGKFDGVHRGHQKLMLKILDKKHEGLLSTVFAINGREKYLILTREEQRELLENMGADVLIDCPFVPEIYTMTPEEFVQGILINRLHAAYIAVGTDFHFGHNRAGSAQFLKENEERFGFQVDIVEKEKYRGREISSTYIREILETADMETAAKLLGRPFYVSGTVVHGCHIGTGMGMPTANLVPTPEKLLPPDGVYFSDVLAEGNIYHGFTNVGYKPTVNGKFRGVETYIDAANLNLYGKRIKVALRHFERPEIKFNSIEQLKEQIQKDISLGREYFGE